MIRPLTSDESYQPWIALGPVSGFLRSASALPIVSLGVNYLGIKAHAILYLTFHENMADNHKMLD